MVQMGSDRQPMNPIKSFFSKIRCKLFVWCLEREIFNRIFPHLEHEADYGYPFHSDEDLQKFCQDGAIAALPFVQQIECDIRRMPKAYGEAFRYILYRELKVRKEMPKARVKMFQMLARRRIHQETCDPQFVARRAT